MLDFFRQYGADMVRFSLDHLVLVFTAMAIASAISVPLGILLVVLARLGLRRLAEGVISVVNVIQPIPSLAFVALTAALFLYLRENVGLDLPTIGRFPGLVALVAYALLPILRNTYTGLRQVDPTIIEVARGMGMTRAQTLWRVELPLALPFIMAGIRIATVWTIGVATLVSLVGAGGLGNLIFRGLSRGRWELILSGAAPAVGLALIFDWLLGLLEKRLSAGVEKESPR
jgi:osmoprotectant transport system permease protein